MSLIEVSEESSDGNDIIIVGDNTNKRSMSPIITSPSKRQKPNSYDNTVKDNGDGVLLMPSEPLELEDDEFYEQIIEDSDVEIIEKPDTPICTNDWVKTQRGDNHYEVLCIVCYGEVENATVTKCGHVYCFKCLHEYINKGYTECAVCRQKLALNLNRLIKMKYTVVPRDS